MLPNGSLVTGGVLTVDGGAWLEQGMLTRD
jgi:hypothetical protein